MWQEYRLATLFWHAERLTSEQKDFIRRRARSANTFWAARTVYFRALALHGTRADAHVMRDLAETDPNSEIVRALIIAGAESGHLTPHRLKLMGRDNEDLRTLVTYLEGRGWSVPPLSF